MISMEKISVMKLTNMQRQYSIRWEWRTMGQYHDCYLLTDVLLLADVFESFRSFALVHYQVWTLLTTGQYPRLLGMHSC